MATAGFGKAPDQILVRSLEEQNLNTVAKLAQQSHLLFAPLHKRRTTGIDNHGNRLIAAVRQFQEFVKHDQRQIIDDEISGILQSSSPGAFPGA